MTQSLAQQGMVVFNITKARFDIMILRGVLVLISIFIFTSIVFGNYIKNSLQYNYSIFTCSFKIRETMRSLFAHLHALNLHVIINTHYSSRFVKSHTSLFRTLFSWIRSIEN